jgi:Short C-terminal domain
MTLQVHAEGITPYEVEDQWMVKAKDTVALSGSIPIKVDRSDHQKVAIDWDLVRSEYEDHKRGRQEALASGAAAPGVVVNSSDRQVINLEGGDLGQAEEVLRQLGVNVDLDQQIAASMEAQRAFGSATSNSAPAGVANDDTLSQLERLAGLRDSGALTDEEFEQQKRRILGGGQASSGPRGEVER